MGIIVVWGRFGCRDYGEYEEADDGQIRDGNGSGDAIAKLAKMITDGWPPGVAIPVLPHVPDRRRGRAPARHQYHHQLPMRILHL